MVFLLYMMVLTWSNMYQVMSQEGRFGLYGPKIDESFTKKSPKTKGASRYIVWNNLTAIPAFDQKNKTDKLVVSKIDCLTNIFIRRYRKFNKHHYLIPKRLSLKMDLYCVLEKSIEPYSSLTSITKKKLNKASTFTL